MVIAVDAGNSSIHIGFFKESGLVTGKIATDPGKTSAHYRGVLHGLVHAHHHAHHIENEGVRVIISSVVAGLGAELKDAFEDVLPQGAPVNVFHHRMNSGLAFDIDNPEELGTDRIANAAGAYGRFQSAVGVCDFGTATTLSFVDANARFLGGAILPGIHIMNDVLGQRASRLAKVELRLPSAALGRNTEKCILSGLYFGTAGAAEMIFAEIEKETGTAFRFVVTGGHGEAVSRLIRREHDLLPNLTLEGLKFLDEQNRP